ncbi:hypothetical protein Tco_1505943 [Tanacetum coccineum]
MRQPPNTLDMRLDDNPKIRGYNVKDFDGSLIRKSMVHSRSSEWSELSRLGKQVMLGYFIEANRNCQIIVRHIPPILRDALEGIFWSFSMDIWHGFMKELHEFLFDSDWDQLSHPPDIVCMECGSDMVPKLRAKGNRMNDEKFGTFEEMDGYASGPDEEDTHNSFSIYFLKL